MCLNPQKTADLVIFTEKILNGKIHFLCRVAFSVNSSLSGIATCILQFLRFFVFYGENYDMTKTLASIIFKKMLLKVIYVKSFNSLHIAHYKLNFHK